jgi:small ligand-binding sensory domain FIST
MVKEDSVARALLDSALQKLKRAELSKALLGYGNDPLGALIFIDAGRGMKLFKEPGYETREISQFMPNVPVSGFFGCAQIGPASTTRSKELGRSIPTIVHNTSSVIAFIRKRSATTPTNGDEVSAGSCK